MVRSTTQLPVISYQRLLQHLPLKQPVLRTDSEEDGKRREQPGSPGRSWQRTEEGEAELQSAGARCESPCPRCRDATGKPSRRRPAGPPAGSGSVANPLHGGLLPPAGGHGSPRARVGLSLGLGQNPLPQEAPKRRRAGLRLACAAGVAPLRAPDLPESPARAESPSAHPLPGATWLLGDPPEAPGGFFSPGKVPRSLPRHGVPLW